MTADARAAHLWLAEADADLQFDVAGVSEWNHALGERVKVQRLSTM